VTRLPDGAAGLGIIPVAAAWGSSFIFIRAALPALGTFGVAEARALLGGLAVTSLVFARGRRLRFGQGLARYTVLGAQASAAPYILMCYATEQQGGLRSLRCFSPPCRCSVRASRRSGSGGVPR
jgi:drug/metabolite transporter (DMT)-like permease